MLFVLHKNIVFSSNFLHLKNRVFHRLSYTPKMSLKMTVLLAHWAAWLHVQAHPTPETNDRPAPAKPYFPPTILHPPKMSFSTLCPTPGNSLFRFPSYTLSHWATGLHVKALSTHKFVISTDHPAPENSFFWLRVLHNDILFLGDRPTPQKMHFSLTVLHPKSEFEDDGPCRPLGRCAARAGTSYTRNK